MSAGPVQASSKPPSANDRVDVWTGVLDAEQLKALRGAGVDLEDVLVARGAATGSARVEVTMTGAQARELASSGIKLQLKRVNGRSAALRASKLAAAGGVFRPYSGPGNLQEELLQVAADNPKIAQAVTIGHSGQGTA
ncbi:MAG: zinc carboxypeptidase, partial [Solirubrobacteraceae bacterium]